MKLRNIAMLVGAVSLFSFGAQAAQTTLQFIKPTGQASPDRKIRSVNLQHYADGIFNDAKAMELDLESKLRNAMNNISKVKSVSYVDVDTSKLSAHFKGEGSGRVSLTVGNLGIKTEARVDGVGFLCPTVKAKIKMTNIRPRAEYNYSNGQLTDLNVTYGRDVDLSCSGGIFSFPGVAQLVSLFASNYAEAVVDDMIKDNLRNFMDIQNQKDMFGLKQVIQKPSVAGPLQTIEREFNIDVEQVANNLFTGVNLVVSVFRDKYGSNKHEIQLVLFQTMPTITPISGGRFTTSAAGADSYARFAYSGRWSNSDWTPGILYNGQFIGAVAFNKYYNLPSFLAQKQVTLGNCGKACE